jgi:hypothetical protein
MPPQLKYKPARSGSQHNPEGKSKMSVNNQKSNEDLAAQTNAELELRSRALDQEMRELDLVIKRTQVAEIKRKQQMELDRVRTAQQAVNQFLANRRLAQANCNHKKGGVGANAVINGQGQSAMSCVIKHKLPCGKYFVLCQRCGKEWHPELTALQNGGVPRKATRGYYEALQLQTNNSDSGSSMFTFSIAEPRFTEEETE